MESSDRWDAAIAASAISISGGFPGSAAAANERTTASYDMPAKHPGAWKPCHQDA